MTSTDALRENILAAARRSKDASRTIGLLTTSQKNTILRTAAAALHERADEILAANQKDIDDARSRGTSDAMIDRLALDSARIDGIAGGLTQVGTLSLPILKSSPPLPPVWCSAGLRSKILTLHISTPMIASPPMGKSG